MDARTKTFAPVASSTAPLDQRSQIPSALDLALLTRARARHRECRRSNAGADHGFRDANFGCGNIWNLANSR